MNIGRPPPLRLEVIEIQSPCPAPWDKMRGDDRVRFCTECNLHVYNLSALSREEATRLLIERSETGGRLCVRLYKRSDGTVITRDCGGGVRAAARRAAKLAGTAVGVVLCAALAPVLIGAPTRKPDPDPPGFGATVDTTVAGSWDRLVHPLGRLRAWMHQRSVPAPPRGALMGDIVMPMRPSTSPSAPIVGKVTACPTPAQP
jgi:hypothetical protein